MDVHDGNLFGEWVNSSSANRAAANETILALALHNCTAGFETLAGQFAQSLDSIAPDDVAEALT